MPLFGPPNVAKMKSAGDVNGLIKGLYYEKNSDIRGAAAETLGLLGGTTAALALIQMLKVEKVWYVRKLAVTALENMNNENILPQLCVMLRAGELDDLHQDVEHLIVKFGPRAVLPMVTALDTTPAHFPYYIENIIDQAGGMYLDPLMNIVKDLNSTGRRSACLYLARLADPAAIAVLVSCLSDESNEIRTFASFGLCKIGELALDAVLNLLSGGNPDTRKWAIQILGKINNKKGVEPILTQIASEDAEVRQAAIIALGQLADSHASQALVDRLSVEQENLRPLIIKALGSVGGSPALDALTRLFSQLADGPQKIDCALALLNLEDPIGKEYVMGLLDDHNRRISIIEALPVVKDMEIIEKLAKVFISKGGLPATWNLVPRELPDEEHLFIAVEKALTRMGGMAVPALMNSMTRLIQDIEYLESVDQYARDHSPEVGMFIARTWHAMDAVIRVLGGIIGVNFSSYGEWIVWWKENKSLYNMRGQTSE